jgi:hypothetical protein
MNTNTREKHKYIKTNTSNRLTNVCKQNTVLLKMSIFLQIALAAETRLSEELALKL